jgi:hypothetical protein
MNSSIRHSSLALLSVPFIALAGGVASAEEPVSVDTASSSHFDHATPTVSQAFELSLGAGYAQGVGDIADGRASMQDVSGAGGTVELQLGYRLTPNLAIGTYGSYARFVNGTAFGSDVNARGATAGVFADWHFRPERSVDPWMGIGSGWRGLWLAPDVGKNTSLSGWEIIRLQGGVDYRVTPAIALGPVLGASVNTFFSGDAPGTTGFEEIDEPRANVYFFAGFQGRFDMFGDVKSSKPSTLASIER